MARTASGNPWKQTVSFAISKELLGRVDDEVLRIETETHVKMSRSEFINKLLIGYFLINEDVDNEKRCFEYEL